MNTVILQSIKSNVGGIVVKISFDMRQVSGPMTGEALLEELMHEISNVWKLPCSAVENIKQHLSKPQHSQFIEEIKVKLKDSKILTLT